MSEQLYRIYIDASWIGTTKGYGPQPLVDSLIEDGVLVPVEPCEHGKIDEHICTVNGETWHMVFPPGLHLARCPGAGIGGDE